MELRSVDELVHNMISSDLTHSGFTPLTGHHQSYTPSYVNVSIYTRLRDTALDYSGLRSRSQPLLPADKMSMNFQYNNIF